MAILQGEVKRELLIKVDEVSDSSYGCTPQNRTIFDLIKYGLVNLDKPSGPTSHEVVAWVKKAIPIKLNKTANTTHIALNIFFLLYV